MDIKKIKTPNDVDYTLFMFIVMLGMRMISPKPSKNK